MENCDRHNCTRKPAQSLSFHESWDRTLPKNYSNSKDDIDKAKENEKNYTEER